MVRREQYRKTHKVTPCPDQREISYLWHLLAINPLHAWIYNQHPSCNRIQAQDPSCCSALPSAPWAAGRSRILMFYFIASKKELISFQYPSRGHFGTDQVGPPVFTHVWFDMKMSLVWWERHLFSYKTHLDRGLCQSCIRIMPSSLLDCACRKSLSSSTQAGDRLTNPSLIANFSARQTKPALTYLLLTGPHWWEIFLTWWWPGNLLCCSSSRGLA